MSTPVPEINLRDYRFDIAALRAENSDLRQRIEAQARALALYRMATDWLDAEPWREKVTDSRIRLALTALSSSRKNYDGSIGTTAEKREEAQ